MRAAFQTLIVADGKGVSTVTSGGVMLAASARSASVRTDVKDVLTRAGDELVKDRLDPGDDPAVLALKEQAHDAVEAGEFARAEALLNEASAKDLEAAQQLQEIAATRLRSAAASRAANGDLKRTQLAYAEGAAYYQQAVEVVESVPTAKLELAEYLNAWGTACASRKLVALVTQQIQSNRPTPGRVKSSRGSVKGGAPQGPAGSIQRQYRRTPAPPHTRLGPRGHQNGPSLHSHSVAVDQIGDHRAVLGRVVTAQAGSGADGRGFAGHYGWSPSALS